MVPKVYSSPIQEPVSGKAKSARYSSALVKTRKIGCQKVDPMFNELQSKFRAIYTNIEALYNSCAAYKACQKSFFYSSTKLIESFRLILETGIEDFHDCITPDSGFADSPVPMGEEKQRTTEVLEYFYALYGLPSDRRDFCISKLSKQMLAIATRLDEDFKFFDQGVQTPLRMVYQVCSSISRIIIARNAASTEYMEVEEMFARHEQMMQNSPGSPRDRLYASYFEHDSDLKNARIKFETLNDLLKDNLERFIDIIRKFMKEWLMVYYYSTLRIAYALYHFSWTSPEFKKIAFKGLSRPHHELISNSHILAHFHAQNDVVAREIGKLDIVNHDRFYGTSLETLHRAFKELSSDARHS